MSIYIVRPRGIGKATARALADGIGGSVRVLHRHVINDHDIAVPWGVQVAGAVINNAQAMRRSQDKFLCRTMLMQAGVPCPFTAERPMAEMGDRVVIRPRRHMQGREFYIAFAGTEADEIAARVAERAGGCYCSALFPKDREYRAYVAHGKVLAIADKGAALADFPANRAVTGDSWRLLRIKEWKTSLIEAVARAALRACDAVGLDYGAVDVMTNATPAVSVCEINTAPTLAGQLIIAKHVAYLRWLRQNNWIVPHWDHGRRRKALSLRWSASNFQGKEEA